MKLRLFDIFDIFKQSRQVKLQSVKHNAIIYITIVMHDPITHTAHSMPRYTGVFFFEFCTQSIRVFGNLYQTEHNRIQKYFVAFKLFCGR